MRWNKWALRRWRLARFLWRPVPSLWVWHIADRLSFPRWLRALAHAEKSHRTSRFLNNPRIIGACRGALRDAVRRQAGA